MDWFVVVGRVMPIEPIASCTDSAIPTRDACAWLRGIRVLIPRLLKWMGLACWSNTAKLGISWASGLVHMFENAAAGIERYWAMSTQVCVSALPASDVIVSGVTGASLEDVKILFGDETLAAGHRELETERTYGQCCE